MKNVRERVCEQRHWYDAPGSTFSAIEAWGASSMLDNLCYSRITEITKEELWTLTRT